MEGLSYFVLLSLVFSSKIGSSSELRTEDYVNLVLDIQDAYDPAAVLLIYFTDTDNILEMKIFFELMVAMSKKHIQTLTVPLKERSVDTITNYTDFTNKTQEVKQSTRSMSVILFTSKSAIEKLNQFSGQMILEVSINLLLFMTNDVPLNKYCIESFRDQFQFSFLGTILFKCCGDKTIRKWYPFNAKGIEFVTWGFWDPDTRLIKKKTNSVHTRRANLGGKVLRIATVQGSTVTQWKDGKLSGYLIDILHILEEIMNFKTILVKEAKEFGSWNKSSQTWSGAMGLIVAGEVDLVVSDLSMTPERMVSVDFTIPLFWSEDTLYVKKPTSEKAIAWTRYFQPFNYKIWIAIGVLIITTPLVLTLITSKLNKNSRTLFNLIEECYFNVWRIYCQQGLQEFPTTSSLRLAYFSIFLCSFIVMSLYSASLISYLTVPTSHLPFSNFEGFVKDGSYNLIITKDGSEYDMFKDSNESMYKKIFKLIVPRDDLPLTVNDGFKMVCNQKIAYYNSGSLNQLISAYIPCEMVQIRTGRFDSSGMVLQKGSPYISALNYHLTQLRDRGLLNRAESKYFFTGSQPSTENISSIGISGIVILLVILAGGIGLGIILLCYEKIYYKH